MELKPITISLYKINELFLNKLINIRSHPHLPIVVLKYSKEASYSGALKTDPYLRMCRGLVIDYEGNIVARGLDKFFNFEELTDGEVDNIMENSPIITEKFDGTCLLLTEYDGQKFFYTLGSFTSEQAIYANRIQPTLIPDIDKLNTSEYTYMFEFIYPEDAKVVKYDGIHLKFICRINNKTGKDEFVWEMPVGEERKYINECLDCVSGIGCDGSSGSALKIAEDLKAMNLENKEGFVVRNKYGDRMKIKFENYLEKFRVKYSYSINDAWEDWKTMEMSYDDFFHKMKWEEEMVMKIEEYFHKWDEEYDKLYDEILQSYNSFIINGKPERKEFAMMVKNSKYSGGLFLLYDEHSKSRFETYIYSLMEKEHKNIKKLG